MAILNSKCTQQAGCPSTGTVSILLGKGDGTFSAPVNYAVGYFPTMIAVGDFNGDGKLDLAVSNHDLQPGFLGAVSVLLGNGDGTFQPYVNYATDHDPRFIVVGDFNEDGKLDVATSDFDGLIDILLGKGDGTFQSPVANGGGLFITSMSVWDFNGDGKLDLVVNNFCSVGECGPPAVYVLLGNGDGSLQAPVKYLVPNVPLFLATADFNNDGILDIVALGCPTNNNSCIQGSVNILFGSESGAFSLGSYSTLVNHELDAAAFGDFNGDGNLDIAVAGNVWGCDGNCFGSSVISVYLGNGDGTFKPNSDFVVAPDTFALTTGDFNGDGRLDFASNAYLANEVSVSLQNAAKPIVSFSPAFVAFGSEVINTTSKNARITLKYTGSDTLTLTKLTPSASFSVNTMGITVNPCNPSATTLAKNQSCAFNVNYAPGDALNTAIGNVTASFTGDPERSTLQLQLSGSGTEVYLSTTTLPFGTVPSGTKNMYVKVTNKGTASLNFYGTPTIAGSGAAQFTVLPYSAPSTSTCLDGQGPLNQDQSCTFTLQFTSTGAGISYSETMSIFDNGGSSPQIVKITAKD